MHGPCNMAKNLLIFYDTTTNELIQTLLQQTQYRYYLMGRSKKHGHYDYELCL